MPVDLHIHSTASDGTLTPEQIVRQALDKGLTAIAVADHDTTAGVGAAQEAACNRGLDVLPAVEISTQRGGQELHILGYLIDPWEPTLTAALEQARTARLERVREMVRRLQALGLRLSFEEVAASANGAALGRPHVAAALARAGAVQGSQEAFQRYLRRGRPAYVERQKVAPADAIALIRGAGGAAVLAHPGLAQCDGLVSDLVAGGLVGIEAYHVDHTPAQTERYVHLGKTLGLLITGGSDSHGPAGPTPVEIGCVPVPDECAAALRAWAARAA